MLQKVFHKQSHEFGVGVLMDLSCCWVLPLESGGLLCITVSIIFDCLEHARSELCAQTPKRAFLFQILDYDVLQIVHFKFYLFT